MKYETKDGYSFRVVEPTMQDQIKELLERVAEMIRSRDKDKESNEDQSS